MPNKDRLERFMDKVKKGESCWTWTGAKGGSGYGQFWDGTRNVPAHHFLLTEAPVKRQQGLEACHHCDNKLCVRPSHIFWGTRSDNMRDCVSKGRLKPQNGLQAAMMSERRVLIGQNNHQCKLTREQALEAKSCPRTRGAATALAKRFGVSLVVICDIRNGKRWTHL